MCLIESGISDSTNDCREGGGWAINACVRKQSL